MPNAPAIIRPALPGDAPALTQCMHAAYSTYLPRMNGSTLPPLTVDYADEIAQAPTWVIESDGAIAGGLILVPQEKVLSLANICVHPNHQGKGLGGQLPAFAEAEAQRRGFSEMRLATHVLLTEVVALYHHHGWTEYDRDQSRVFMHKFPANTP